jgi:hypothetical protein
MASLFTDTGLFLLGLFMAEADTELPSALWKVIILALPIPASRFKLDLFYLLANESENFVD